MSDTNRLSLAYAKETTFGTAPTGASPYQILRLTGESLAQQEAFTNSAEIRSDRNIPDFIRTGLSAGGSINVELSAVSYDDLYAYGVMNTAGATYSSVINAGSVTSVGAPNGSGVQILVGTTMSFTPGAIIRVTGFVTNPLNNGYFKVIGSTPTNTTYVNAVGTAETQAGAARQFARVINGATFNTLSLEKTYTDLSAPSNFELLTGMGIDGFSAKVSANTIATGSFDFIGKRAITNTSAITSVYTAATSTQVFNGIDSVAQFTEGQVITPATDFSLTAKNNLRARLQIGTLGAISVGTGSFLVNGTFQAYYNNVATSSGVFDKYLNGTYSSILVVFVDAVGTGYYYELPRIRYSTGKRVAGAQNQDVLVDLAYNAMYDSTSGYTMAIGKIA